MGGGWGGGIFDSTLFLGGLDFSRSNKEGVFFVAGRGVLKNLKIRGSAWVSWLALFCECFILNIFRRIPLKAWYF